LRRRFRPAYWLAGCMIAQLALGAGTWVVKYGWPLVGTTLSWAAGYTVVAESTGQVLVTTAHVANGSLILALGVTLALRAATELPDGIVAHTQSTRSAAAQKAATSPQNHATTPVRLEVAL
ncbi:MAG: hypothetical protein KDA63_17865, partial [Planctomycetales bacterium]|nr:hypothetical protein [Planctomycetales bacterium]